MVEIGRVRVKTGNAPIEQKISAYDFSPNGTTDVRSGSIATEMDCKRHVRFTPIATELRTSLEVRSVP